MNPYDEIIDQIWLENKHIFRSRREIEFYLSRYFNIVAEHLKNKENMYYSGLGPIMLKGIGYGKRKRIRDNKAYRAYKIKHLSYSELNKKFIDESFPD